MFTAHLLLRKSVLSQTGYPSSASNPPPFAGDAVVPGGLLWDLDDSDSASEMEDDVPLGRSTSKGSMGDWRRTPTERVSSRKCHRLKVVSLLLVGGHVS